MPESRNFSSQHFNVEIGISDSDIQIFSWVVYPLICQIINIFGIATNTINSICFVKQGFKDSINLSLLGLSVSDLASLATLSLMCISVPCSLSSTELPFDILDVTYLVSVTPHFAFTRVSSCITAMITFERCLSVAAPLKIKDIATPKRTAAIIIAMFTTFIFSSAPLYVTKRLGTYFSVIKNRTTYGIVYRDPREEIESITLFVNSFVVPFGAFITIVLCTIILSVQLRLKSEWRKINVASEQSDRVSSRNKKVAKMVVLISGLYIVCFVPSSIMMLSIAFEPALFIGGQYVNITIALGGVLYTVEGVNSSMNMFIYHHMSSKFRDTFNKLFYQQKEARRLL